MVRNKKTNKQLGFSLIELVVVIVLLGLLAGGAGMMIVKPIEAYDDLRRRQQLLDQGEMALRQIARDVRRALPNSLRLQPVGSGWALEMVNSIDGARYRDEAGGEFNDTSHRLEFVPGGDSDFNFLGSLNVLSPGALTSNQRLVIYNTSASTIYDDAANNHNPGIITPSTSTLTLSVNTPATEDAEHHLQIAPAFEFSEQSPGQRAFVVDGPISYICDLAANQIRRHQGYSFTVNQPSTVMDFSGGNSDAVVTQLTACNMSYNAGSTQRGGLLSIQITIGDASGETLSLMHQVHVMNLP